MAKKSKPLNLTQIKDINQLRDVTRLLENENAQLHEQLQKLSNRVDALQGNDAKTLQLEIERLKAALAGERNKHSKKKSERRRPHRRKDGKPPEERDAQTGAARTEQPSLPMTTEVFELTDAERACPCCGDVAEVMEGAFETSEYIEVVVREFRVVTAKRQKAVHSCECAPQKIVVAPGAIKAVPKGKFSLNFAIEIAVAKYHDHIPLELQATQMGRQGLKVRPDVLWNQLEHQAAHWEATYEAIRRGCLESPSLGTDDTGWPMLEVGRKNWQVFALTTPKLTFIEIGPTKAHERVVELLTHPEKGPYSGIIMCDGAANFTAAQKVMPTFQIANDWSHARRKFIEAAPNFPQANEVLDLIGKLFEFERLATESGDDLYTARSRIRDQLSRPMTQKIKDWMKNNAGGWDGSNLNRAISYTSRRWDQLTLYLDHPEVGLHNNDSEFALRKPVRGRKNFHGTKSPNGAKVASMAYTLCETARKNGILPSDYLREVFMRSTATPGTATLPQDP